jgi:heme O synthase-like polyprenyltransferase
MLTILSWMVFVPAVIWNVVFWVVAFGAVFEQKNKVWANRRNFRDAIISLALLFIPGVYLFGL